MLIEVSDSGVGVPEARLTEMNLRLDNPPVIDVSVSRHMGLFAVARLAERHGVRVRLRARSPRGLIALVWLPDSVTERGTGPVPLVRRPAGRQAAGQARIAGNHGRPARRPGRPVRQQPVRQQPVRERLVRRRADAGAGRDADADGADTGGADASRGRSARARAGRRLGGVGLVPQPAVLRAG